MPSLSEPANPTEASSNGTVERGEDRLGVVPVGGVGGGHRVGGHEDRVAARVVDGCRVRPAVARAAAAVAVDGRIEAHEQLERGAAVGLGLGVNASRIRTAFRLGSVT